MEALIDLYFEVGYTAFCQSSKLGSNFKTWNRH